MSLAVLLPSSVRDMSSDSSGMSALLCISGRSDRSGRPWVCMAGGRKSFVVLELEESGCDITVTTYGSSDGPSGPKKPSRLDCTEGCLCTVMSKDVGCAP